MNLSRGIQLGALRSLYPVLLKWQKLMVDPYWIRVKDAKWWYNERASLSVFAGAIWLCRGQVFEEFVTEKMIRTRKREYWGKGRCDVWFKLRNKEFIAEAKQCWPVISSNMDAAVNQTRQYLQRACRQAKQMRQAGYCRLGMVFVIPRIHVDHKNEAGKLLREFISLLQALDKVTTLAWVFPPRTRSLRGSYMRHLIYPGVILLMKPVSLDHCG